MSSPAGTKIGRFVVRARVGAGAFGTVYRAYDPQLDREVALKVPQKGTLASPKAAERFLREAKAAARLRHPHIVPVFEAAHDAACPYIATAFIEGRTLAHVLDTQPPAFRHAVQVVHDLADALAYAHEHGVVHRDVKPANVMLDEKGRALLMDFGLAHSRAEAGAGRSEDDGADPGLPPPASPLLTAQGAVLGTPSYMSPEQARGAQGPIQPASDQYSLGVVLYELLCGQTPFTGPVGVVLYNVVHTDPPPPRSIRPSVPPELEAICLKAMAKRPADRYAAMTDFAAALAAYLWTATAPATATATAAHSADRAFSEMTLDADPAPKRRSRDRPAVAAAVSVALLAAAAGVYVALRPHHGTVRLELSDPKAEVALRLNGRDLPAAEWAAPMRLPVGKYELEATGKAVEPVKQSFDVVRGENEPVRVELKPRALAPPKAPEAAKYPPPIDADKMITNSIGMKLAFVPKGKFPMGGGNGKVGEEVVIPHDFYVGTHEVTQGDWKAVLKEPNPSQFSRAGGRRAAVSGTTDADLERFPVDSVTWDDAQRFLAALNAKEKKAGWVYRLPKEAEWEYACRGGPASRPGDHAFDYYADQPTNQLTPKQANVEAGGAGLGRTCRVGSYPPNRRGLFDMHGNVWELCDDTRDAFGMPGHACRGGGYQDQAAKASTPHSVPESYKDQNVGFRVVLAKTADVAWTAEDIREGRVPAPDTSKAKKLFDDAFADPKSGFENHTDPDGSREVYLGGKYVITNPSRSMRRAHYVQNFPVGEGAFELRARLRGGPTDVWDLQLNNYQQKLGIGVRVRNNGSILVAPGGVDSVPDGLSGPSVPLVSHPALKKNGEPNTLLLVLRKGTAEVYVNGAAVFAPITLDPTFDPKRLQFVLSTVDAGEVEFERLTVYAADGLPRLAPTPRP